MTSDELKHFEKSARDMLPAIENIAKEISEQSEPCRCDSCLRGLTKAKKSDADLGKCSVCDHPHLCAHCD